ncbi:MAG: hypothetical protein ACLR0N_14790 [Bilophila wadsworthia]
MRYVQNLLNSDVKINLVEIVTQNKDAITSRLMMNVNSLDITANKLSDRLKAEESSGKLKTQDLIEQYAKENNTDDLFTANRDGMALFDGGRKLDISGRHYFRLAIDGIPNISDKLISSTGMRFSSSACRSRITGKSWGPYKRSLHSRKCTRYVPSPSFPRRAICM